MAMFKEAADIKTSDQLHLPVPDAKFETVVVKPSEIQQDMVQALSERAAEVHSGSVDPSVDNMLKITSDGRKIGLDQRLMNSALPDDPNSKLNACVNNVLRIWNDTKEQKLTQLIFCDTNPVQLCSCSADALHLRLRHLHCLPSDLESVPYLAGSRIPLLCPLFRRNCHHRGHRAF